MCSSNTSVPYFTLSIETVDLLTGIFARSGQICSVKDLMCTVSLKARCIRKGMFGPTGSPAHLVNVYKESFFLLSTKTEALIGVGSTLDRGFCGERKQTVCVLLAFTSCWERWDWSIGQSHMSIPRAPMGRPETWELLRALERGRQGLPLSQGRRKSKCDREESYLCSLERNQCERWPWGKSE